MGDNSILTFRETHHQTLNNVIHNLWISIFKDTNSININLYILNLVSDKFTSLRQFKYFLKKQKINYRKIDVNNIEIDSHIFKLILLTYGTNELRTYISNLPIMIQEYDQYILNRNLMYMKNNSAIFNSQ